MGMPRYWTSYWRGVHWLANTEFSEIKYSGGNFSKRVAPGDFVYIVSVQRGQLLVGGRMQVAEIVSRDEAVLRRNNNDLYDVPEWVVGKSGTGTPLHLRRIVASELARNLRFLSSRPILTFKEHGGLDEQTLRVSRELSADSALLLDEIIRATDSLPHESGQLTVSRMLLDQWSISLPEEVTSSTYQEGLAERILVNRYERDPGARRACIDHHGAVCAACRVDLASRYGSAAKGLIHIHHLLPIAVRGTVYDLDPIRELRPVCPNCHSVIHRRTPPYSIEEIRSFLSLMER
jgi:hypothetical protein